MTSLTTFYLSGITGKEVFGSDGDVIGVIRDLMVNAVPSGQNDPNQQMITGIKLKIGKETKLYSFTTFRVVKVRENISVTCYDLIELSSEEISEGLLLAENIQDKQIVDLNGRKLVRVNDVRLATLPTGTYAVAVDIGISGLLRRIGILVPMQRVLSLFRINIPSKYILWDDVQAIDFSNLNIKLSKSYAKLHTLHPSDLADILEDLGKKSSTSVFSALDEEKAADVLEEMETDTQVHIIESLPVGKAADVLEKMPADEAADILDEIEDEKAELLLNEMDSELSQEVRELLEYPDHLAGGLMTTDVLSFSPELTVDDVIRELRIKKPEPSELYSLFVTEGDDRLAGVFSLSDLVIAEPETVLSELMKTDPVFLYDDQRIDDIAEIISKYNLLAVPVVDRENMLQGMVVVDDVIEDLMSKRRTFKR
ncbi:MAG TPA: CBS domain-containing protein [Bacteroidales bacterium]|jgi:CBS domain-containing protein/sporulation protein YlmC with PRC-barrel domain|nr:CBS domain-containing protein [Bacteroidales bacterium]HNY53211.1 CBS domain-containing protein [Bacteroidales bacterium]HOG57142.1 CBS domain-containing protein [Bacteroidales bacterium]HPX44535.1 CBS domain-containing protein [Bacteroidales bacterium]HQB87310.1 CBS domain-containing protein [Bacteroidales bacterium]